MTEYPVRITAAQKMSVLLVLELRTCNILYINDSERKLRPPSLRFIRFRMVYRLFVNSFRI